MDTQHSVNYERIAKAIDYLKTNFKAQPALEEVAQKVNLSHFHFQRLFTDWAGVSPKKFLQFISVEYAKEMLLQPNATLADAAFETGLSGTGRLHDLFIKMEGMTPGEFKNGGRLLHINYSFAESPFGIILVASTAKGICYMAFADEREKALEEMKRTFPNANWQQNVDLIQQHALYIFTHDWKKIDQIKLHLKGTPFQLKVWETLLKIPLGHLATYSRVANAIGSPKACRAVGSAIGDNPVAFLIPCHRIIRSNGNLGGYHWGNVRKSAIIGWEAAKGSVAD